MSFHEPMKHVRLCPEVRQQLDAEENDRGLQRRAWTPMVSPPRRWSSPIGGGYLSINVPLFMRRHREMKTLMKLVRDGLDLSRVCAALNRLQETPWRINKAVLEVAKEEFAARRSNGRLLPEEPAWRQDDEGDDESHVDRMKKLGKRDQFRRTVEQAAELGDEPEIYFPWRLDTRGRMYPLPEPLSPQGSNLAKALLLFAESAPLASLAALEALLRHGANVFGQGKDRLTAAEQVAFMSGAEMIRRVRVIAEDAVANIDEWSSASKPWLFLAFAIEYARYLDHVESGRDPLAFASALPVSIDATCSAFQHVAMLTRDEKLAALVNLIGTDRNDLYTKVADELKHIAAASTNPLLHRWLESGLIGREAAKKPSMTALYGSQQHGLRRTVKEFLLDQLEAATDQGRLFPFHRDEFDLAADALVAAHRRALARVAPGAAEYLKLARRMGRKVAAAGVDPLWHLPTGFVAIQSYREPFGFRIHTRLFGKSYYTNAVVDGPAIDEEKNARSFAANLIHSLDAEHLRLTFELLPSIPLASVHDCLQVRATDAPKAREALVDALRDLHRENRLRQVWEQLRLHSWRDHFSELIGDGNMPPWSLLRGQLDLDDITGEYAFC